ncbi:hypothetical protein [Nocardioides sp. GXQ0305]|uniref:hypothetical protein n=1 Tax=Nocardioides sp. GXQ0305 TaxID=3423912 RepID=UPI003D7C668A
MWRLLGPASAALLLLLTGCSGDASTPAGGHSHAGGIQVSLPVGDGTQATEVGYRLRDVEIDGPAGETGEVRFRIEDFRGRTVTKYVEELTKDLHLYVVREDLDVFRHLHPTMADDGTWTAPVSLPAAGDYRVIAEFVARDPGGNGDHVILGESVPVSGPDAEVVATDPMLQVEVVRDPVAGPDGRLVLRVRDDRERPVRVGTYLGTYGHVTGFDRDDGSMVHLHPLSQPRPTDQGTELTFHTEIEEPGDYLMFLQVRVDGFLHAVPVPVTVTDSAGA